MQTVDCVKYNVTKVDDKNFTVDSLASGFLDCPEAKEYIFTLNDNSGNLAVVTLIRTGAALAIQQMRFSTAGGNMPNFSGSIEAYSSLGASVINQQFGECIGVYGGESNMQGGKIVAPDPEIDAVYDTITQYRYQSFQNDGITSRGDTRFNLKLRDASDDVHLYWPTQAGLGSALVTSATHAANSMALYAGHTYQQMILGAQWGTAIGTTSGSASDPGAQWSAPAGSLYVRMRDMAIAALNRNPANYLGFLYLMIGVNDAVYGVTPDGSLETDFATILDNLITTFLAEVGASTGRDLSRTPVILVTLPESYISSGGIRATRVNNAILDTPNRLPWVSVIDTSDMEVRVVDTYHWEVEELREIGAERFPTAYFQALTNYPTGIVTAQLVANATGTATVSGDLTISGQLAAAAAGTATITGALTPGGTPPAELAAAPTGIATITGDLSPGSASVALDGLYLKGTGLVDNGGNFESWADQAGGDGNIILTGQSVAARPAVSGGSVVFDGVDDYLALPNVMLDDISGGFTFIIDMESSDDGSGNPFYFGGYHFSLRMSGVNVYFMPHNAFGGIAMTTVSALNDGTRKVIELVCAAPGGTAEMFVDGVSLGTGTVGSNASPNGFYLGSSEQYGTFAALTTHNIAYARREMTTQERTDAKALFL